MTPARAMILLDEWLNGGARLTPEAVEAFDLWRVALSDWVNAQGKHSFDRALGLKAHGGVSPARQLALMERDQYLRDLWRSEPDWCALKPAAAARLMVASGCRYETLQWPREQFRREPPANEPGATWWRIFKLEIGLPGEKQLRRILQMDIQEGV